MRWGACQRCGTHVHAHLLRNACGLCDRDSAACAPRLFSPPSSRRLQGANFGPGLMTAAGIKDTIARWVLRGPRSCLGRPSRPASRQPRVDCPPLLAALSRLKATRASSHAEA